MKAKFALDPAFLEMLGSRCAAINAADKPLYRGEKMPSPSRSDLDDILGAAFWASLRKEEGRFQAFSLVYFPVDPVWAPDPFCLRQPLALTADNLTKLAPALNPRDWLIGVYPHRDGQLSIWGFVPYTEYLTFAFRVRTVEVGQLLASFKNTKERFSAFITDSTADLLDTNCFRMKRWFWDKSSPLPEDDDGSRLMRVHLSAGYFNQALRGMREHGHGGTILLVPPNDSWRTSIHQPVRFGGEPYLKVKNDVTAFGAARDEWLASERGKNLWPGWSRKMLVANKIAQASADAIGRLTAIDGATLVNLDLSILAFGAKIKPVNSERSPSSVSVCEPLLGCSREMIKISDLGGTRHQSAAQFVFDQRDALAVVASQDGAMSVFSWDSDAGSVSVLRRWELTLL